MMKYVRFFEKVLTSFNVRLKSLAKQISKWSIRRALSEKRMTGMLAKLRKTVPDISTQEFSEKDTFDDYIELKKRSLQAFQCFLMLKALEKLPSGRLTVVDIGDSAGTHMRYLKKLTEGKFDVDTISVNLDERAIEKIRRQGLEAIHSRAEEVDLGDKEISFFTSFQMVEHLHNPSIFFRRLAKKSKGKRMVITVPYVKKSRVGLHNIRNGFTHPIRAEEEHIFEFSPEDWSLLMLHSGWKVVHSEIYYQYPRRWVIFNPLWKVFWRTADYEGFWGVILEKDTTYSDCYQDWGE